MDLVLGADLAVGEFVANGLGKNWKEMLPFTAIGASVDGKLVGGVVFHLYRDKDIHITAYSISPKWMNKKLLHYGYNYVYNQLGCVRTTAITGRRNRKTRKLLERLGYRLEGVKRKGFDGKHDLFFYGMLKEECKWL